MVDVQTNPALGKLRGKGFDHRGDQPGSHFHVLTFTGGVFAGAAAHLHQTVAAHAVITLDDCPDLSIENNIGCHDSKTLLFGLLEYLF